MEVTRPGGTTLEIRSRHLSVCFGSENQTYALRPRSTLEKWLNGSKVVIIIFVKTIVTSEQLTLYTAKVCPFAQRDVTKDITCRGLHQVELVLAEAKAEFKSYQIDLANKPDWYAPKVNPASKVPAVAYGGPDVSPETPSRRKLPTDLYPSARLLPSDPVARAKARFFIDVVSTKFIPAYIGFVLRGESRENVLTAVEAVQDLLLAGESTKFAVAGHYTIADAALVPFMARLRISAENDVGTFERGEGKKLVEELQSANYARFNNYINSLFERESFKATFDETNEVYDDQEYVKAMFLKRAGTARAGK
ncbi:hypothetical protein SERLA73DRAFT_158120 [Serpula lacrymans var. lacrymans S7.3]|uniref:GST C-terminal domain-containing protein n=2 Tax=Serpula lacrymans var. lacrymans TaxID=341189 RepID=F8PJT2_SERL3|nr:uncharacterized protein SERLADRAFT_412825 [Serpula lacrymans var. lacrymans S7.9]EGO03492.1 hypothetical protein SERLA73DRAFT_158120 [Serpula lacrymans var. lacrymans S7.3]EGO29245.1 hypothetical protein SERLADRAFT_412825 [Serpula lacrymans var. lacrymans S7.9]